MTPPPGLQPLLGDLRAGLEALYGERLERIVLYGSHARGEATDESDVDVLVVLVGEVETGREIRRMDRIRTDLLLDHDAVVSILPIAASDYRSLRYPLVRAAHAEGIAL